YDPEILKQYNKLNLDSKKVFENALYTSIYRFYKEILSVSNTKVKISKSKKAAMLKINIIDLLKGTSSSNTKIQLAK
ncbi:hypothetical protein J9332_41275, partial [Aquimarina celericrescens]|nr:hypothetical protein [Aquimarina celericrescens]